MTKYKMMTLDVWGNETDGYEVNDWYDWEVIDDSKLDDWKAFCEEYLIGSPDQYELRDEYNGFMEITHKETGKPILHFQRVYEDTVK